MGIERSEAQMDKVNNSIVLMFALINRPISKYFQILSGLSQCCRPIYFVKVFNTNRVMNVPKLVFPSSRIPSARRRPWSVGWPHEIVDKPEKQDGIWY